MNAGTTRILTPLGSALIGALIALFPLYLMFEKRMEKKLRAEIETAVRLNQLETVQRSHKDKIWVLEGEVSGLKSRHVEAGK